MKTSFLRIAALLALVMGGLELGYPTRQAIGQEKLSGVRLAPKAFLDAANKVQTSLVVIESFGGSTAVQGKIAGIRGQGEGNTTGVVISSDGLILTSSFNFIQQPPVVTVVAANGKRYTAKIVAKDETRNITLLKAENASDLTPPEFLSPDQVQIGQWAVAVGVGYGDSTPALSSGIVSAIGRGSGRAIQTDANTSPANYGGPLVDIRGRVLGICVPFNPTNPGPAAGVEWYDSGIGFAIPVVSDAEWLNRLKKGETLQFGFLGLRLKPKAEKLEIDKVLENGPAGTAGIAVGDVITKINETVVTDESSLRLTLRKYLAGDSVKVSFMHDNAEKTVEVKLAANAQVPPDPPPMPMPMPMEDPAKKDGK